MLQQVNKEKIIFYIKDNGAGFDMEYADKQASYHQGVNSYVYKPVNFDEFVDIAKALKVYWTEINEAPG